MILNLAHFLPAGTVPQGNGHSLARFRQDGRLDSTIEDFNHIINKEMTIGVLSKYGWNGIGQLHPLEVRGELRSVG